MGNFANFIFETEEVNRLTNPKNVAESFVNMYNKLSKSIFCFVEKENVQNEFGDLVGYLYIYRLQGLRVNFKNGILHSFSKWTNYSSSAPDITTVLKDYKKVTRAGLVSMYGEITNSLAYKKSEQTGYKYRGKVYTSIAGLVTDSYFNRHVSITELLEDLEDFDVSIGSIENYFRIYGKIKGLSIDFNKLYNAEKNIDAVQEVNAPEETDVNPDEIIGIVEEDDNTETIANVEEKVIEPEQNKFADQTLIDQITADPLPVFRKLNSYVLLTAQKINNALLITGQGGVGKSYNVNRILSTFGTEGKDYVIMKGATSTAAMYKFIYDNYNKIVVFDDCDEVLTDDAAINILKAALDTGKTRKLCYNKQKSNIVNTFDCKTHDECEQRLVQWSAQNKGKPAIPNAFQFLGGIIFISNLSSARMAQGKAAALLGRCMQVDIHLLASEVMLRMESCLPNIKVYTTDGTDITNEDLKKEVFEWISSPEFLNDPRIRNKEVSFRLFNKAYMFRYARLPMWKELSFSI